MADPGPDEVTEALAAVARLNAEAADLAERASTGTAVVPAGVPAEQSKTVMVALRHAATAKAAELEAARKHARDLIEAQRNALDAQLAAMAGALAPLQKQAALLEEGIWSVNLYLGTGEQLVTLATGEPAPAGTPITVLQTVLAMDEETAIDPEGGGLDYKDITQFDEWITARPGRITQLIPFERGVVAIMPRRAAKDYGDMWANKTLNEANHATYFLIRNGGCLYRYIAEGFHAGRRLTPSRDEFTGLFTTRRYNWDTRQDETVQLEPGTREWERAEEKAGAAGRHYMRVGLILQGLADRTAVFHPLPAGGLNLLGPEAYEQGLIRLLAEDETALTAGRRPFYEWLAALNKQLRPGMRITGNFGGQAWRDARGDDRDRYGAGHSRLHPAGASWPQAGVIYQVDRRERGALVFLYERTDTVWRRDSWGNLDDGPARQRASARIYPEDTFIIPFDLVTAADCQAYLESRTERHAYADMFPVLRAVIAAKQAESEAEAPMRLLIAGRLMADHRAALEDAEAAAAELVDWWKLANRWHRPLAAFDDPAAEARALAGISREYAARQAAVTDTAENLAVSTIRVSTPGVQLIGRRKDGTWIALAGLPRQYENEPAGVWLREHTWNRTLEGEQVRDWIIPEPGRVARWRVLWTAPAWDGRDLAATPAGHLSDPEITRLIEDALAEAGRQAAAPHPGPHRNSDPRPPLGGQPVAVEHESAHRLNVYWLPADTSDTSQGHVRGAQMTVTWKRTTGGKLAVEHHGLYVTSWREAPWTRYRPSRLAWAAKAGSRDLDAALTAAQTASAIRSAASRRAWDLRAAVAGQWEGTARQAAYAKFIADYADPSLWDDHSKGLKFDCPHLTRGGGSWEKPWERAVDRLTLDGVDLAGLTVAEMAAAYRDRYGDDTVEGFAARDRLTIPEDIAGYRFP